MKGHSMRDIVTYLLLSLLLSAVASCAVLSESQQRSIASLSILGSEVGRSPGAIIESLSEVRVTRGLFYSSTLTREDLHIESLESIALSQERDRRMASKFDAGISFLDSYLSALRSLSHENRYVEYGREVRSLSRTLSSTLEELHSIGWIDEELPTDVIRSSGYLISHLSESYMRRRQMSLLRDYIREGDTIVGVAVDSMVSILKSESLKELISHERAALKSDYTAFLRTLPSGSTIEYDRLYIESLSIVERAEKMRRSCITGLQAFRRAHRRMVKEVGRRQDISEVIEELETLATEGARLRSLIVSVNR